MRNLVATIVAVAIGAGCGSGQQGAKHHQQVLMISYVYEEGGIFYHGTISRLDGFPRATWTYERNGKRETSDARITEEGYASVCEAIGKLDDFTKHIVSDPKQEMDFKTNHVVGVSLSIDGKIKIQNYLIPAQGPSKEFGEWLKLIGMPLK